VKLRIEPWLIYSPIKSGFCLDPDMKRVLFIGHYTVQIWIFKNGEPPRLQFIWCRPVKVSIVIYISLLNFYPNYIENLLLIF